MTGRIFAALLSGGLLSACTTTSFAPPSVDLEYETMVHGSNFSVGQRCMSSRRQNEGGDILIARNATGAQRLIDNFVYRYRCASHAAANGRQGFEVPALITGVGTAAAAAFGAGPNVAIAGGTATALLSGGKDYYAPQPKAAIYDSALDAVLCIKMTAAGVDPFTVDKIGAIEGGTSSIDIPVTTDQRYYETIAAALFSVKRVLAQRLSVVGTFDPAGVIAEIKALEKEEAIAVEVATADAPGEAARLLTAGVAAPGQAKDAVAEIMPSSADRTAAERKIERALIGMAALQPKLQECVVRAKI